MTDTWRVKLTQCNQAMPQCLISCFLGCIGIAIVQVQTFNKIDKPTLMPALCALTCCCFGTGYNRKKLRHHYKIKGSYFIDCILYALPIYSCLAAQEYAEVIKRKEIKIESDPIVKFINPPMISPDPQPNPPHERRSETFSDEKSIVSISDISLSGNVNEDVEVQIVSPKDESFVDNNPHTYIEMYPLHYMQKETETSIEQENSMESYVDLIKPETGILPLDGDNPNVYSFKIGYGPFSFLKGDPYYEAGPPPTYMTLEYLKTPKPTGIKEILYGLESHKNGGLICVDQEAISKQKGIIKEVIGSIIKNIASGLGAVSISLPVRIFEPRTAGERLIDKFSFASTFLNQAALLDNPIDRFKRVMAFAVSGLYLGARQEKPFNPLLGETVQCHFPDGTEVYVEHTSHNPPRDHFDVLGKGYRMWGYLELDGTLSFNTLTGEFRGNTYIYFNNSGQLVKFTQPKLKLGGMMTGDRTLNWEGEFEFKDQKTGLYGAIRIGDDKNKWAVKKKKMRKDDFIGKIWEFNYAESKQGRALVTVSGSWMKKFVALGDKKEKIWQIDRDLPVRHIPVDVPLPSDWRYREDLIWLSKKNLEYASHWKGRIEARQRADRGLRAEHLKKK